MAEATIKLSDGREYTLSTLNVGDLIEVEKKLGSLQVDSNKIENIMFWLFLSLKKKQDSLTLEGLYELVDAPYISKGGLEDVFSKMSELNGWTSDSKNVEGLAKEKV